MPVTLDQLNTAALPEALRLLDGLYEHSPWVAAAALQQRPFQSLAQLKYCLAQAVDAADLEAQLNLIRAHPQLAGRAMQSQRLSAASTQEQDQAGLTHCSAAEFDQLQQLNTAYHAKFGWPFILALRGPRGLPLSRADIITNFERRLHSQAVFERLECLRNIHRIAELRLNDWFGISPTLGNLVWDWHEDLSQYSDTPEQLSVSYLTEAHNACALHLSRCMQDCGFDSVDIDALGNVVGRYESNSYTGNSIQGYSPKTSKTLLTGSHYDTVRNAGKYDGRLGIFVPMACVRELHRTGQRLPFALEVVAFAEEEGQRFNTAFLASAALTGAFQPEWLALCDANGLSLRAALLHVGLNPDDIAQVKRDPTQYLGFVEVHIEQGPVLNHLNLPLGVVSAINASVRYSGRVIGCASHAGTTPMALRADALCAVAELALYLEQRARADSDSVATMGQIAVPHGSVNVVPGECVFSLDIRAPNDLQRNKIERDALQMLEQICQRRALRFELEQTLRASAATSDPNWQQAWESAVAQLGLPVQRLPSGAGHDAMQLHTVMPQAMLFVRGQNGGISHNPLESCTSDDLQLAVEALAQLLAETDDTA